MTSQPPPIAPAVPSAQPPGTLPGLSAGTLRWLAADLGGENPQPVFRGPSPDMPVRALESLPPEIARGIGRGSARRVLPFRLQDRYNRRREEREFRSLVIDNGLLRATILPDLGGRLVSLFDLTSQTELLFRNPVFQPANLALRDAWFAGGIEWNIGHYGHAHHTCSPVFAARIPGLGGGDGLRIYDFERLNGSLWQIDFHLPPGSHFLLACTRILNPRPADIDLYWWTNIAVPETPGLRVLAPATDSVFVGYNDPSGLLAYGQAPLPGLPTIGGRDGTYPENLHFTNEFFFQCRNEPMPWEAALDASGHGLVEASTQPLGYRKVFSWGMHQGGRRWQESLSQAGMPYIEIQAGLGPTQQHTVPLAAGAEASWLQVFGPLAVDPALAHHPDWPTARAGVAAAVGKILSPQDLERMQAGCREVAETAPMEILVPGTGWGALEAARRARSNEPAFPPNWAFPAATLGPEQSRWLDLLEGEDLLESPPASPPGAWMIQAEWQRILEDRHSSEAAARHWFSWLHLGVMRMENGDEAGAAAAWEESMASTANAWACRNLAVRAARRGAPEEAIRLHEQAWKLAENAGEPDVSFAVELLGALLEASRFQHVRTFARSLPPPLGDSDPVRLLEAKAALELDDLDFVEAVLAREFATIREGARDLTDLWFGVRMKRLAATRGIPPSPALLDEVKQSQRPPSSIDFRVFE